MNLYSIPWCRGRHGCCETWLAGAGIVRAILCWVFLGWGLSVHAVGEQNDQVRSLDASEETAAASPIYRWVEELDDDHYVVREAAQQRLVAAGSLALEAVAAKAADQGASLEGITRSVRILAAWSESKDASLRLAALEKLASLANRPLEAALATEVLRRLYERNAIEAIERLGGVCEPVNPLPGNVRIPEHYKKQQPLRVTLGADWKGTDEDLQCLSQIRRATVVSFYSTPIGDRSLVHLTKIPALKRVEIYGTQLSAESIGKLRKQLPKTVTIDVRRSGAKLGIGGSPLQGMAQVATILSGSAADRGGLRQHDIITHVAGEPIDSFEVLTQRIATYQPGDTVELTLQRKGKTVKTKVTFDRWGTNTESGKR